MKMLLKPLITTEAQLGKSEALIFHLAGLFNAGNVNLYAYSYDWDDHRRYIVADFKNLLEQLMLQRFLSWLAMQIGWRLSFI